ncbi:MAG: hypothetical protein ACLVJH_19035 [Faecalibacterium prausnitzii]
MKDQNPSKPYIPAEKITAEMTATSVIMGIILSVVFGAANAYLGLRVGMTVSAPSRQQSFLAGRDPRPAREELHSGEQHGADHRFRRRALAAGAIFTMPALFLWSRGLCDKPSILEIT